MGTHRIRDLYPVDSEYDDEELTERERDFIYWSVDCFWCYSRVLCGADWKWFSLESGAFCPTHRGLWYHEPHIDLSQFSP